MPAGTSKTSAAFMASSDHQWKRRPTPIGTVSSRRSQSFGSSSNFAASAGETVLSLVRSEAAARVIG